MIRPSLNLKHLRYFWAVGRWGSVAAAAEKLHLTPQTLSGQIKLLEDQLGHSLLRQAGRGLELTDVGRLAWSYADEMFSLGAELQSALSRFPPTQRTRLVVGVADQVPKSIAHRLLAPTLAEEANARLVCREGRLDSLLAELAMHRLDVVLADRPMPAGLSVRAYCHRLGECAVGLFAAPELARACRAGFPASLQGRPLLLPGEDATTRTALLEWLEARRAVPEVVAEFDDTALMKAFGRAGAGLFPAPLILADELRAHFGCELVGAAGGVREHYYAITARRRTDSALVQGVIDAAAANLAGANPDAA